MRIGDAHWRSIWIDSSSRALKIIDQSLLPHAVETRTLASVDDVIDAIRSMRVRGAPLIGAAAAHGLALALVADPSDSGLDEAYESLLATRPTAINLKWGLDRVRRAVIAEPPLLRAERALSEAIAICEEDVVVCSAIGDHGKTVLESLVATRCTREKDGPGADGDLAKDRPLQILTHCNAGWLATVDWGTALAPVYKAHDAGLSLHVWVDETRPRNQGGALTAFELRQHGVPHTVIVDNAGGHLMQRGLIDVVLVGSDRATATGDVCNKIGTYLKALAAAANRIPFYVALPVSSIDWSIRNGLTEIPIEERSADEVRIMTGRAPDGRVVDVELFDVASPAANPAFDVTPASLVTGLITEHGTFAANRSSLDDLRRIAVESMAQHP